MKAIIPYGKKEIEIEIPDKNILDIVKAGTPASTKSEKNIIKEALLNPIDSPKLKDLSRGKASACILTSDITRPCPSYRFLPCILGFTQK